MASRKLPKMVCSPIAPRAAASTSSVVSGMRLICPARPVDADGGHAGDCERDQRAAGRQQAFEGQQPRPAPQRRAEHPIALVDPVEVGGERHHRGEMGGGEREARDDRPTGAERALAAGDPEQVEEGADHHERAERVPRTAGRPNTQAGLSISM
jgi:hypothetical protein